MHTTEDVLNYITGGRGKITVKSLRSGEHFTYSFYTWSDRIFAKVLTGSDNQSDYTYLGMLDTAGLRATAKSRIGESAPSFKALNWVMKMCLAKNEKLFEQAEINHSGVCGRCGRELTTPESIERGIGPVCAGKS